MRIDQAADLVVARCRAAGLRAALDPRDLNPPCVWVQLAGFDLAPGFGPCGWVGEWVLWAVAPDAGTAAAYRTLGDLVDKIHTAFPTVTAGLTQALTLPAGGDPLPAIRLTLTAKATADPAPPEQET